MMSADVEVRYLLIEWQSEGVARRIELAPSSLEVERCAEGGYLVETAIFNDFHPWLGIRVTDEKVGEVFPVFLSASGQEMPMMQVSDAESGSWWVRADGWDSIHKRHLTELQRSPGLYNVRIANTWLKIDNRLSGYGKADIQAYVDDFRGDLLWMIMNEASAAIAADHSFGVSSEFSAALSQFLSALERVLKSPAVSIREVFAPQPIQKLRPGLATFPHYMRNPSARHLPGRSFRESADTAENRYLRHMLGGCCKWATAYVSAAQRQVRFLERLAEQEGNRARISREMRVRPVNPDVFDQQTVDLKNKLDAIHNFKGDPEVKGGGSVDRRFPLRLKKRYYQNSGFFYEPQQVSLPSKIGQVDYRYVELPAESFDLIRRSHYFCKLFSITGNASSETVETKSGKKYLHLKFSSVRRIEPQTDVLEGRSVKRESLERSGWLSPISSNELREIEQEARTAEQREKLAEKRKDIISYALEEIGLFSERLTINDADLNALGVSSSSQFPTGMRFVSNPDYAACLRAFNRIGSIFSRGGMDLSSLEKIASVGILHVSDIYEKWCLIKIFMIITKDFRFQPEEGWEEKLIATSLARSRNVKFEFSRPDIDMKAVLTVQAEMPTGKRPDFVLETFSASYQPDDNFSEAGDFRGGVVMDAKFRGSWSLTDLQSTLDELIEVKGYCKAVKSERVFVLQPCEFTLRPPLSPLEWGFHCDYGGEASHRKGWIQVGVSTSGERSILHLKRLLAMVFQSVFPEPRQCLNDGEGQHYWVSNSFCIGCGERHAPLSIQAKTTRGGQVQWKFTCGRCGLWATRTHCYECGQHLFKNGTRWTYHKTVADQVTNVICPSCDAYFDEDWV